MEISKLNFFEFAKLRPFYIWSFESLTSTRLKNYSSLYFRTPSLLLLLYSHSDRENRRCNPCKFPDSRNVTRESKLQVRLSRQRKSFQNHHHGYSRSLCKRRQRRRSQRRKEPITKQNYIFINEMMKLIRSRI